MRDIDAPRDVDLPRELLTTDVESLIVGADIVIELMGGIEPARTHIITALRAGADVVTGNKALLAEHGAEIFDVADQVGASVSYEAAVAAAIPIIRPLKDSLAGDRIDRISGILNGSTNFILDKMDREGLPAEEAQRIATDLGYLEADPSLDLAGFDAAHKAAILASLAFHTKVSLDDVYREGIEDVTSEMIEGARAAGYVLKLLAVCERLTDAGGESVSVRVYPALIDRQHPMANVYGGNNAVFVEAAAAGPLMFYGAGAGGRETASAVMGDVVSAARRHIAGGVGVGGVAQAQPPRRARRPDRHAVPDPARGERRPRCAAGDRRHLHRRGRLARDGRPGAGRRGHRRIVEPRGHRPDDPQGPRGGAAPDGRAAACEPRRGDRRLGPARRRGMTCAR